METMIANNAVQASVATPETAEDVDLEKELGITFAPENPYNVVVHDDPVNTMHYVVFVFMEHFKYNTKKSTKLMLQVHNDGRSIVWTGGKEEAEQHVQAMHQYGLQSTMEQAG